MAREPSPPPAQSGRRASLEDFGRTSPGDLFWDLITFDRLVTGPVVHIVYWAGLLILLILGFGSVGAAVGAASHEEGLNAWFLGAVFVVIGLLFIGAAALIWRGVCEFYVAVFRISDDLRAIRAQMESGVVLPEAEAPKAAARARKAKAPAAAPTSADPLKFE
ncbi:MAG TPA: DUF4282 domain-containing protein [Caulobacteraceae bacterium]|jgi:hypothetical protein|nr:DUF4282 domain-containing protein [Caulobacteraceae bacterium]